MSSSENEENEKPYPKDSQIENEEENNVENKENENNINNEEDNNFPEEEKNNESENENENGQKQSINNNKQGNEDLNNNNEDNNNEQNEENIQDNTFPEKEENNFEENSNPENQENNNINNINEEKMDDSNNNNNFRDDNEENNDNKENSFRFSKEHQQNTQNSNGPLNLNNKDNEFEYEESNKNADENNNNNDSFGFRDSDINNNNNENNNQYNNDNNNQYNNESKNNNNNNYYNTSIRNSGNSDGINLNNNNNNETNKFNNIDNSNSNNYHNNINNNNYKNNNNFNYVKNPYISDNNNNNNFNNNNNYNNKNPNGGFGYDREVQINQNLTTGAFIPQGPPLINNLNNYNYSSKYNEPISTSHSQDYDPYYERFEQYPEDNDGFEIDPSKRGKDSSTTAGIQIANTIMGAGILAIPLLMSYLGILIGAIILVFLAIITIYTVYILMRCHQITGKSGYSMFGKITLGKVGSILVKIIIIINNMGICICYLRIFGEVFQTIIQSFVSKDSKLMTNWHNYIFILIGGVILFFFIFIKNISSLKKVSYIGVIAVLAFVILLTVLLLYKTIASKLDSDVSWKFLLPDCSFPQAFQAVPTVFIAFLFQFNVFPIYYSLKNRSMRAMFRATKIGVIASLVIFLLVGIIGFLLYGFFDNYDEENYQEIYGEKNNGSATYDTILDKLNDDMILYKGNNVFVVIIIIIICVSFIITCLASFPILFLSLRANYINALEVCRRARNNDTQSLQVIHGQLEKRKHVTLSRKILIIITIVLYLFLIAIAILIYNLTTLFTVIGIISGTFIAFILPNIFYIRIVKISEKNYSLVLSFIILGIGIFFFIMCLVMSFF
jgi:amino acid permease